MVEVTLGVSVFVVVLDALGDAVKVSVDIGVQEPVGVAVTVKVKTGV
jgi:hypothetical protein